MGLMMSGSGEGKGGIRTRVGLGMALGRLMGGTRVALGTAVSCALCSAYCDMASIPQMP